MNLDDITAAMRALGIKRLEIELGDTIPAPGGAPVPSAVPEEQAKGPSDCVALGCTENNGWFAAPEYCRAHGMAAAGVR